MSVEGIQSNLLLLSIIISEEAPSKLHVSSFSSKAILLPLSCLLVGVITLGKWKPILHQRIKKQKCFFSKASLWDWLARFECFRAVCCGSEVCDEIQIQATQPPANQPASILMSKLNYLLNFSSYIKIIRQMHHREFSQSLDVHFRWFCAEWSISKSKSQLWTRGLRSWI